MTPANETSALPLWVFILILVMGGIFFNTGFVHIKEYRAVKKQGIQTGGVVSNRYSKGSGKSRKTYIYVSFNDKNSNIVTFKSRYTSPSLRKGAPVTVAYMPENPARAVVVTYGQEVEGLIWSLGGLLAAAAAFVIYLKGRRQNAYIENLKVIGITDYAPVKAVLDCGLVNKKHVCRIVLDKLYADKGYYLSAYLDFDPSPYIYGGKKLPLITDPSDPEKYIVDISEILAVHKSNSDKETKKAASAFKVEAGMLLSEEAAAEFAPGDGKTSAWKEVSVVVFFIVALVLMFMFK